MSRTSAMLTGLSLATGVARDATDGVPIVKQVLGVASRIVGVAEPLMHVTDKSFEARRVFPKLDNAATSAQLAMASTATPPYLFASTMGQRRLREILRERLPFDPHDYLLDWTAAILDGHHLLGVTATGDGKSCLSYFPLLVMQYFARQSEKPAGWRWPDDPMVLVICPTKGIEEEQAADMTALGIRAMAINQDLLSAARQTGTDLWQQARTTDMLFLSPEMLASPGFAGLVKSKAIWMRIILACVDEMHLIIEWAKNGFRKRFLQIGLLLSRLCPLARICAYSATLLPGPSEAAICKALGVFPGDVVTKRRSNLRANVQFERRVLKSSLAGRSFPELDWIVREANEGRSALIFVDSINTGWRVASHLCRVYPAFSAEHRLDHIRLYNGLSTSQHNQRTRGLLKTAPGTIAIATNALCVGFSSSMISTVAILNPTSLDDVMQKGGRANRVSGGGQLVGRAIVYVPQSALKKAADVVRNAGSSATAARQGRSAAAEEMTLEFARFLVADCVTRAINDAYRNPRQAPCHCRTCNGVPISGTPRTCSCDGCAARSQDAPAGGDRAEEATPKAPIKVSASKAKPTEPLPRPISKGMRTELVGRLRALRDSWYSSAPVFEVAHLPRGAIFPDVLIDDLATRLSLLDSPDKIRHAVRLHRFVLRRVDDVASILLEFQERRSRPRQRNAQGPNPRFYYYTESESEASGSESNDASPSSPSRDVSGSSPPPGDASPRVEDVDTTPSAGPIPPERFYARPPLTATDLNRPPSPAALSAKRARSASQSDANVARKRSRHASTHPIAGSSRRTNAAENSGKENETAAPEEAHRPRRKAALSAVVAIREQI